MMDKRRVTGPDGRLFHARAAVDADWIDHNGHMNMGYYLVAFDAIATAGFYDSIGLGIERKRQLGTTTFSLSSNIDYIHELKHGDTLLFTTQLLDFDHKRLHYIHCVYNERNNTLAATNECLGIYIDMATRRSTRFSSDQLSRFAEELERTRDILPPVSCGRTLGIRR